MTRLTLKIRKKGFLRLHRAHFFYKEKSSKYKGKLTSGSYWLSFLTWWSNQFHFSTKLLHLQRRFCRHPYRCDLCPTYVVCHRWHLQIMSDVRCQRWQMTDISCIIMDVYRSVFANAAIWSKNEIDRTFMWGMRANTIRLLIFLCILKIFLCKKNGLGATSKTLFFDFLKAN